MEQARPSRLPPGSKGTGESRTGSTSVCDVVFDEDRHQLRTANGPEIMAALRNLTTRPHPPDPRPRRRYRLHHQIPVTTTKTSHQTHHPTNHLTRLCRPPAQLTDLPLSASLSQLTRRPSCGPGRWRAPSCILRPSYLPSGGQVIRRSDRGDSAFLLDDLTHHLLFELPGVSRCWHSLHPIDSREKTPQSKKHHALHTI